MATTRGQVRATVDLVAKRKLQKLDGATVIFEVSGTTASGYVTSSVPVSASAGLAVSGSSGLIVQQGDISLHSGGQITQTGGIVKVSGDLQVSSGHFKVGNNVESLIANTSTGFITAQAGFAVSGSTTTSGSLTVGGNGSLSVTGGGISGSSTLQAGGDLTVGGNATVQGNLDVVGNMTVRGTPTIINTDVLEVKDNIVVINKVSGSDAAYVSASAGLYVNRGNAETASLLWVSSSNDWQFAKTVGGTPSSADLVVNKLKPLLISGSSGVSINSELTIAATASLHTSGAFSNVTIPTSSVTVEGATYKVFNLDTAFHAIDSALANAGISAVSVQNAYTRLRYQASGNFDVNGFVEVPLPAQVSSVDAFPTSSFNYVTAEVMVKSGGRWINDLVAVELVVSGASNNAIHVLIDAPALTNTDEYRLIAINNDPAKFVI